MSPYIELIAIVVYVNYNQWNVFFSWLNDFSRLLETKL